MSEYGGILALTTTNRITLSDNVFTGGRINGNTFGGAALFSQTINSPSNLINANRFFNNTGASGARQALYVTATMNLTLSNNLFDKTDQTTWIEGSNSAINSITFTNNLSNEVAFTPNCPIDAVPLSIALLNFEAIYENKSVKLLWSTASETNNLGFEIQRSDDANSFSTIGFVGSMTHNGNSRDALSYEFRDQNEVTKKFYYSLVQKDFDNNLAISKIIFITNINNPEDISIFPNPTRDKVNIHGLKGNEEIILYDQTGQVIYRQLCNSIITEITLEHIKNGIYNIQIVSKDNKVIYHRVVIKI